MKLEQQVISLSLAKRLKELGVRQESVFWWISPEDSDKWPPKLVYKTALGAFYENGAGLNEKTWELAPVRYAAFTVAELGEMLPYGYKIETWKRGENTFNFELVDKKTGHTLFVEDGTEAEARGLMLAYLIENKLITL